MLVSERVWFMVMLSGVVCSILKVLKSCFVNNVIDMLLFHFLLFCIGTFFDVMRH